MQQYATLTAAGVSHCLSVCIQVPDTDKFSQSRLQLNARINVCMGGNAPAQLTALGVSDLPVCLYSGA